MVEENLEVTGSADDFTASRLLFLSWKRWCDDRNLASGTETAFVESLKDRGYEQHRKTIARGFKGVVLKQSSMLEE
jgi:hypothetical protein